jgi:LPS export ABC transporter protein LptC
MIRRAALTAFVLLTACNPTAQVTSTPTPSPSPRAPGLALKVSGSGTKSQPVRFVEQEQKTNRVQYEIIAARFESVGPAGSAHVKFDTAHVTFHGKDGSTLVADAPQAIIDQTANTIEMTGGVHAHNARGSTLTCDDLQYDHLTEMIYGSGNVVITSANGFRATGSKFQSDVSLTHTRMQ